MSYDYFDRVTGSTEYERQSWRDSYNGGWAAGDWTGNTNARIAAEREAFNGATWEGSSSQPSALEWARMGGGLSLPAGGAGASQTAGPGNARVGTSGASSGVGSGAGAGAVVTGPLTVKVNDEATGLLLGGGWWKSNPFWSDANEWENRYAEPGEWVGGIVTMGADVLYNFARGADYFFDTRLTSGKPTKVLEEASKSSPGAWGDVAGAFARQGDLWSQQINDWFWPAVSGRDGVVDGQQTVIRTGGGF
ncbi:hypothetical protein GHV40_11930 [Devosia sp. D6-9]|nr:hypothetical protein GHV40_11930 [Devosia sp. D6-9]